MVSLVKGLSTELARHNILVNSVAPGWVATDMSNPVLETKKGQKMASTVIPLGRPGTPEEIAGPILFLASDLANFMTGEIINVNGGSVLVRLKPLEVFVTKIAWLTGVAALCGALHSDGCTRSIPIPLLPEQSTAKAKQILQELINAMGGPSYTEVRESNCEGRLARFGHNSELTGYTPFKVYWRFPDKNRTDYSKRA